MVAKILLAGLYVVASTQQYLTNTVSPVRSSLHGANKSQLLVVRYAHLKRLQQLLYAEFEEDEC